MAMSAERKAELSAKGKKRWADSKAIGERLSRPTERVHNAYGSIVRAGLLEVALSADSTNAELEAVTYLIDATAGNVKIHDEEDESSLKTPADQLKVAMWFINKIGSPEQAIKAVKAAASAIKSLEES